MKHITKALSSILLAASIAVGSVAVSEITSVSASAADTHDLSITGYVSFYLTQGEYTDIEYRFSGEGIAAVHLRTSDNMTAYTKNVRWIEYPGTCQAFYCIKNLDGNDGTLQFSLLDDDYQEAMTFNTNILVEKEPAQITFNDMYFPTSINEGEHCHISGEITSTDMIDSIEAYVFQYGSSNVVLYSSVSPDRTSYGLYDSDLDNGIDFSKLSAGSYYISYHVTSGTKEEYYTIDFNVNSTVPVEPTVTFSDMYFPSSIDEGNGQHVSGTISSTQNIDTIQAIVYNSDSNAVLSAKQYPNSKSYSLYDSDLDWALSFSQLLPGDYTLTYFVASGSADRSYTHNFTVKAEEPAVPVVSFENMSFPSSFEQDTDPVMNGNIRSTQNVDYLSIEVRDSYGNIVLYSYNNLAWWYITLQDSGMNTDIDFSKLDAGDYTINYYASSGLGSNTYTQYFTVYPAYKPDPVITFSSMSFSESIPKGNGQHISGTISSTDEIDTIQAVVTDSSGKVWLNAKRYPGQNTYSLFNSALDWDLSFSELPAGDYKLTYFVASGATDRSYTHTFTVRENTEDGAIILFHDMEFPENIAVGKGQHIKGTITSSGIIKKVQAVITDSSGKEIKSAVKYPNTGSYTLYDSELDWALPFSGLGAGSYTLTYNVTAGSSTQSYSCNFTVGKNTSTKLSLEKGFAYCAKWWNKRNKSWPNNGSDCANFASQFLAASGLPKDSQFKPGTRVVKGFDNLKKYLYKNYGVQTIMRKKYSDCLAVEEGFAKYKSNLSYKDIKPGDLVVMPGYDSNGNKINDGHIMIVYKVSGSKIYCYGHSNDRNGKTFYVSDSYIQGVVKTSALFG